MPAVTIPLGKMRFDLGASAGNHLWFAGNAVMHESGYELAPGWELHATQAIAGGMTGAGTFKSATNCFVYAGNLTNIYKWIAIGAGAWGAAGAIGRPTPGPGPAGVNYNTATSTDGWFFAQFGPYVLAVNGVDNIQIATPESAVVGNTYFNDINVAAFPTCANPTAKYIISHKNHVIIANVTLGAAYGVLSAGANPNLVWWSGLDNGIAFGDITMSPSIDGTGWKQVFDGDGDITGLVGGYDAAFVFKSGSVHRIDGPPFQINCISNSFGTIYPRSITRLGDRIYFWSAGGPAYIDTRSNAVELMSTDGAARILSLFDRNNDLCSAPILTDKTLENVTFPPGDASFPTLTALSFPSSGIVAFFTGNETIPVTPTSPQTSYVKALLYNTATDSWSIVLTNLLGVPFPVDTLTKASGLVTESIAKHSLLLTSTSTDHLVYKPSYSGTQTIGHFRLPFLPFTDVPGQRTRIIKFRIRYRRAEDDTTVQGNLAPLYYGYKLLSTDDEKFRWNNYGGTYMTTSTSTAPISSTDGWVTIPNSPAALWHSLEANLWIDSTNAYEIIGCITAIEIVYEKAGYA